MLHKRIQKFALIALAVWSGCALANPSGPTVVNGTATFSQPNVNTLNVTNSRNAIINWQSFNIGRGQTTNFIQPSSASAVMNRVISNNPSQIYGNLNSNGKVFLINQHGLMIGAGARINTAGFYGSTLNITNEDFLKGNLKFDGGGFGGIVNQGYIHAGPNGNVVLVAPDIENGGVIEVDNGNVILAAGESIRITSLNDASIEFDVQSPDNGIINLGDIIAKQGAARLFAGNLKHSGSINATGLVQNADGSISLVAQDQIEVSGTVTAASGKIEILADDIKIRSGAYIDASGQQGGGEILIGGDQQGLNPAVRNATSTTIESGAEVHADAIGDGDGGRVIVFAENDVHVHGEVTARGGPQGGDGGFIETSGLEVLDITHAPDASAVNGEAGEWLIDPNDITIVPDTGSEDPNNYSLPFVSTIDSTFLGTALINSSLDAGTSVTIVTGGVGVQQGNILVQDAIIKSAGADTSLTLRAHNDITINADIRSSVGILNIILDADSDSTGGGQIELGATNLDANGGTIDASNEIVFINNNSFTQLVNSDMSIQTLILIEGSLAGAGNITVSGLTTWNTLDTSSLDEGFTLDGPGILFAGGGFNLGANLNNDTLTLDRVLVIGAPSLWTDAGLAGNTITTGSGSGTIVNDIQIDAQNGAQLNVAVPVTNSGRIDKTAGAGDLSFSSTLGMQPGSALNVDAGSVTAAFPFFLSGGSVLEGFGTFNGNVFSNGGTVNVDGAIGSTGTLTINGNLSLDATSTVVFDFCADAGCTQNDVLNVTGAVTLAGNFAGFWADQFTAADSQVFTLIPSATSISGNFAPGNVYGPAGVTLSSFVNNTTSLDFVTDSVATGDIIFWSNQSGGSWGVDTNWVGNSAPLSNQYAVINVDSDVIVITLDSIEAVAGVEIQNNLQLVDGGQLTIDDLGAAGNSLISGDVFAIIGTGAGDGIVVEDNILVASQTTWSAGDIAGAGIVTIHPLGSLSIAPGAGDLDVALIHNSEVGSIWSGGASTTGAGSILNNGSLTMSGGFTSNIPINNVPGGVIVKDNSSTTSLTGTVIAGGVFQIDAGTLDLQDPVSINGTFDVASGATLQFQGGVLSAAGIFEGTGTIDVSTTASFTSGGIIAPGGTAGIGTLTFNGDVDLGPSNFLNIEISNGGGAPVAGVDYDQLVIIGDTDLQGFMNLIGVNGYTVTDGDTFVPITYGASATNGLSFGPVGTENVLPTYNANDLTLQLGFSQLTNWTGGGVDDLWNNPANWDNGVPGAVDDAVIPVGSSFNITIAAAANAGSLSLAGDATITQTGSSFALAFDSTLQGGLILTGGSFANSGVLTMDGANGVLTLNGGQLQGGTIATTAGGSVQLAANSTLDAATLNADLVIGNNQRLTVTNGLTLNGTITLANTGGTASLRFTNPQTLAGSGAIVMDGSSGPNNFVDSAGGTGTLTIGSGINISGTGTVGTNSAGYLTLNLGTITANAGDTIQNDFMTNGVGGSLVVDGGTMTMAFAWDNLGTMTVDNGGAFNLGGPFNSSAISGGAYINLDGASTTTITGTMDIGGGNFTITDAGTGTGNLQMVPGGEIANGTLLQSGAATLLITPSSPFAQLNNVALAMDLNVGNGGTLEILNDLRINIGRTLTLASSGSPTTLQASNPQSILGNGSIVLGGSSALNFIDSIGAAGTLTIGAGINISGSGTIGTNSAGLLTLNNGTITANAGDVINTDLLTNGTTGSLVVNGGTMIMNFAWGNLGGAGSIDVSNGGSFELGGSFNSGAIDSGRYLNSDGSGTTTLTGVMDIQGGSFTFTDAITGIGDIEIFGGTLLNGTIDQAGSATLSMAAGSGNLDNVIVDMDLDITNGRTLTIFNGLTINSGRTITLTSLGGGAFLNFNGTQTLTGNGAILLDDTTNGGNLVRAVTGGDTLTIDTGITISGGGTVGSSTAGINAINNGTITAGAGNTIFFQNFTNNGVLSATGGGILDFSVNVPFNDGIIDIGVGSTLTTGNANLNNIPGAIIRGSGTIDVGTGTLANDGIIQPGGNLATGVLTILGNFTMGSTSDLQIEFNDTGVVAGADFDQLVVTGAAVTAALDGSLTQSLLGGNPVAGTYRFIDVTGGGTLSGTFGLESLVVGFSGVSYNATFAETTFALGGIFWDDGAGDGFWNSAANWSGDVVPLIGDDVTIGVFNVTIAAAANASTLSLASGGAVTLTGGIFTIASNAQFDGDLSVSGGTLTGNGAITVNGNLSWTGGGIGGAGLLTTNGFGSWNQGGGLTLSRNWTNGSTGSINWSSGNLAVNTNATFINDGTLTISGLNQSLTLTTGTTFNNRVILSIDNGTTTTFSGNGTFTNSGLIDVISTTRLDIRTAIGTDTGTWNIGPGSRIAINGGARTLSGGFSIASTGGDLEIANGTLTVATTSLLTLPSGLGVTVSGGTLTGPQDLTVDGGLTLAGGSLNLSGNLTTNGVFDWTSAANSTIDGGGTGNLTINGALNITGNNFHSFSGITVNNFGVTSYLAAGGSTALRLNDGTTFNNNGLFDIQDNLLVGNISGVAAFNNQAGGELRKSGGTAAATIVAGIAYTNSSASINIQSGSLTVNGGAALTLDSTSVLEGSGTFNGSLTNNGTIRPGGTSTIGTLSINGVFINTGIIEIEIDNIAGGPGSGYDELAIIGGNQANLGGNLVLLSINGYSVANNDFLTPLSFASSVTNSLTFTAIGGETVTEVYNPTDLDITLSFSGLFTWTGLGGDAFWNNPANWDKGVPDSGSDASIVGPGFNVTIAGMAIANSLALGAGDTLTLAAGGDLFVINDSTLNGAFVMNGGTLDLTNMILTLAGGFTWNGGGTIQSDGSGTLDLPGITQVSGAGIHTLSSVTVNNSSVFVLNSASPDDFQLEDGATFNNSGSFDFANDSNIFDDSGVPGTFNNNGGNLIKSVGAGTSTIGSGITFNNTTAVIEVNSGTLALGVSPLTLDSGSFLSGTGILANDVVNNGTVTPGGVGATGILSIAGDFSNGVTGTVVIEIQNGLAQAGTDYDQLAVSGQADFDGTLQLNVIGTYTVANNDSFNPITYATWSDSPFATILPIGGEIVTPDYVAPDLTLALSLTGLFTFTGAIDNSWNNAGNWDQGIPGIGNDALIPAGFTVTIAAAANAGTLSLATGSTLDINSGGVLTIANSATFDGLLSINAGGLDITGAIATVNAGLNWTGTSVITGGTLNLNSAFNISGGASNILDGVVANASSVTTYSAGNLTLANGSALNVNGVFDFAGNLGIVDGGVATSSFNSFNGATIVKSAGASSSVDSTLLSAHAGSVDVQTGNLDLNLALLDLGTGDVFSGAGNYIGDVVNNGGIVRPGAAGTVGTLSVTGAFIHNGGTLEIDISAAAVFDQLAVSSGTFTGGTIDVNLLGYIPTVGEQQQVILCAAPCVGSFASITSPAGIVYGQTTNAIANDLTLDVVSVAFAWDGGGDGVSWTDDFNWSLDVAPDNTIDVVLPGVNVAVDGAAFANNLTINGTLSLLGGGTLTTNNFTGNAGSNLTIAGGTLVTNGVVQIDGALNLNSGALQLNAGGTLLNLNNNWRGGAISGAASLVLGGVPGATTLALSGAADKTLDTITLDMNLNDIAVAGSGNIVLVNGATIDNTNGQSFIHNGSGDILGTGTFINTGGRFSNLSGQTVIGPNVNFINDNASLVGVQGGTLVMRDTDAGDLATYQIGNAGILQVDADRTFGDGATGGVINSSGTVNVSGTATATMNLLSGQFVTNKLVVGPAATLAGDPVTVLQGFQWGGGTLASAALTTAPGSTMAISGLNATLPAVANINGNVVLNNPAGTTLDLNGNLLQLDNGATLSGAGNVIGNVINASGVVVTGGAGNLADLTITGNYAQGAGSALVVEVFNNGFNTVSDQLTVTGTTSLNGGVLVVGFTTNSLGLVTADFQPLDLQGGVSGNFTRVFDAGGNILAFNFSAGVFTVVGVSPKIPDSVIDDLIRFFENNEEFAELIASNRSEAEAVMEALLSEGDREEGSLVCN